MTWNSFHRREDTLRAVIAAADVRRDGLLPMDVPGVSQTFGDELDLLSALQLKWHARLSGSIERELMAQPLDLGAAVARAWASTAHELPGIRLIIDHYTDTPADGPMDRALHRAQEREWVRLAVAAGLASDESAAAARAGRGVEERARTAPASPAANDDEVARLGLVERIRAVLAA